MPSLTGGGGGEGQDSRSVSRPVLLRVHYVDEVVLSVLPAPLYACLPVCQSVYLCVLNPLVPLVLPSLLLSSLLLSLLLLLLSLLLLLLLLSLSLLCCYC